VERSGTARTFSFQIANTKEGFAKQLGGVATKDCPNSDLDLRLNGKNHHNKRKSGHGKDRADPGKRLGLLEKGSHWGEKGKEAAAVKKVSPFHFPGN